MRFMIIVKATADSEAGIMPPPGTFEAMGHFNQALIDAGILLAAEGLHPSSQGARVTSEAGGLVVGMGPLPRARS